jgi:hypothetical protein
MTAILSTIAPVIPSNPQSSPPLPAVTAQPACRAGISPRKLILAVILVCSIFCFFLILFATAVAILREASPAHGYAGRIGLTSLIIRLKRVAHHVVNIAHHK